MIINYNTEKYPFREIVSEILDVEDLCKIHEVRYDDNFKRENYIKGVGGALQATYFHKKFYENKEKFLILYKWWKCFWNRKKYIYKSNKYV